MSAQTVLLVTGDEALLEAVLRLSAAAGVVPDVAPHPAAALAAWGQAALVLVGADQVAALADRRPARREQVYVVSAGTAAAPLFRGAVQLGAEAVVELPVADAWLVEVLTDAADGGRRSAVTVAVVGGSGGAGASTFACALGLAAASPRRPVVLVDADPWGPGLDRIAGLEDGAGSRWDALATAAGRFSSRSLREALPQRDGLAVLSWGAARGPMDPSVMREVLSAAQRGSELLVVDLPRRLDEVARQVLSRSDHVIVVSALTLTGVASSGQVVAAVREVAEHVQLLTRGREAALDPLHVARSFDVPLLTSMGNQKRLDEFVALGLGPLPAQRGPLARAARDVLRQLTPVRVVAA